MPDYRRCRVPGGTFFFMVNLLDRSHLLVTQIDALREAIRRVRARTAPRRRLDRPSRPHALLVDPAFAGAGSCRTAMPIFPAAGAQSRRRFQNPCTSANRDHRS